MPASFVVASNLQANNVASLGDVTADGNVGAATLSSSGLSTLDSLTVTTTSSLGAASATTLGLSGLATLAGVSSTTLSSSGLATLNSLQVTAGTTLGTSFDANGVVLTNLGAPTASAHATTKLYVDNAIAASTAGIATKHQARVISKISNVDVTTGGLLTIDGVTLVAGDRVLLAAQTDPLENLVYIAAAGAWSAASDFAPASSAKSAYVFVDEGVTFRDSGWLQATNNAVVGTDGLEWNLFTRNARYRDYRFTFASQLDANYLALTLSNFTPSTTQRIKFSLVQKSDATNIPFAAEYDGYVQVDGLGDITKFDLVNYYGVNGALDVSVSGGNTLSFVVQNAGEVERSGFHTLSAFDSNGNYAALTVTAGSGSTML